MKSKATTTRVETGGFFARLIHAVTSQFQRLFRKKSTDGPNIYPFF
jgi:hypothetical protein